MKKQELFVLAAFVLVKFILQSFLIDPGYDLHRDEYLHLDQGNHLALGYASVPPFTSWVSFLIKMLGNGVFWVKFFPTLFGTLTMVVVWMTVKELKGNLFAKVLAATCVLFSALLRLNTLYQPNSFDVLCWTATFFFFVKFINTDNSKWIYLTAIAFALGFLNKYNIGFLALGLLPAILLTRTRKILLKKEIYLAMVLALIIIAPNLYWQYQNDFPVVRHMVELASSQLVNVDRFSFLKNQLLFFTGSLAVILAALYGLIFSATFNKYRFFFWSFVFTLAIFTYLRAKDYYAIGLYPVYIAFGSTYLAGLLNNKAGKIVKPVLLLLPLLVIYGMYDIAFPNKTPEYIINNQEMYKSMGMLRWEDGKDHQIPQDYADMLGWSELAVKVDKAYEQINDPDRTLVICDNYGQAGAINYYSKLKINAVSFNADYVNWFDLTKSYAHLIRVKNRRERNNEFEETAPYFEFSQVYDSITNNYAREFGTTIFVFKNTTIDMNKRIQEELDQINHRE